MDNDDDKIRQLFANCNFEPASSDEDFIEELLKNIDSVKAVKQEIELGTKRSRKAAIIGAAAGFCAGVSATTILYIIGTFRFKLPYISDLISGAELSWIAIAAISVLTSMGAHMIARRQLSVIN